MEFGLVRYQKVSWAGNDFKALLIEVKHSAAHMECGGYQDRFMEIFFAQDLCGEGSVLSGIDAFWFDKDFIGWNVEGLKDSEGDNGFCAAIGVDLSAAEEYRQVKFFLESYGGK